MSSAGLAGLAGLFTAYVREMAGDNSQSSDAISPASPASPAARTPPTSLITSSRNLPPPLAPMPPSPELIRSLVVDTDIPIDVVRRWLEGGSVPGDVRDHLREALWRPLRNLADSHRRPQRIASGSTLSGTSRELTARRPIAFGDRDNGSIARSHTPPRHRSSVPCEAGASRCYPRAGRLGPLSARRVAFPLPRGNPSRGAASLQPAAVHPAPVGLSPLARRWTFSLFSQAATAAESSTARCN